MRKAQLTRWRGANHPDTLEADRQLRAARLSISLRTNGTDVLAAALELAAQDEHRELVTT